mgnify:FL=1
MEILSIIENASAFIPVKKKKKNMLDNSKVETKETVKEEIVNTVDPEILKMIKENKKDE